MAPKMSNNLGKGLIQKRKVTLSVSRSKFFLALATIITCHNFSSPLLPPGSPGNFHLAT